MKLRHVLLGASLVCVVAASAVTVGSSAFAGTAKVTGTVKLDPTVSLPDMPVIKMDADPKCVANNSGKEVKANFLVLGADKTVANVLITVKSGLPAGKTYPTPTDPVTLDQHGCMYMPHIIAAMKGQTVKILNSDGTLHNIHGLPASNTEFNVAMPAFKKEMDKTFDKTEAPFRVKCDVHPWMGGFMAVMDNPYFAVTKEDGKFEISGLDAGTYDIEIWHEKLGTQTIKVTVADGETKMQDVTLTKPAQVGQLDAVMLVK